MRCGADRGGLFKKCAVSPVRGEDLSARSNASFAKRPLKVRARTPDTAHAASVERKSAMTTDKMDDKDIERMIDIIGDGARTGASGRIRKWLTDWRLETGTGAKA